MHLTLNLLILLAAPPAVTEPAADDHGYLTVTALAWGAVKVDGALVTPETPLFKYRLAAGKHTVTLCPEGDCAAGLRTRAVQIQPGRNKMVHFRTARGDGAKAAADSPTPAGPATVRAAKQHIILGERAQAAALLESLLEEDPSHVRAHRLLCAIYGRLDRKDEALTHCRRWRALEREPSLHSAIDRMVRKLESELQASEPKR